MIRGDASARPQQPRFLSPLTARILAVNVFALLMLGGGVLYLDEFRIRLIEQRRGELSAQAALMADSFAEIAALEPLDPTLEPRRTSELLATLATDALARVRILTPDGRLLADSALVVPGHRVEATSLKKPGWRREAAQFLDQMIETIGSSPTLPPYDEPSPAQIRRLPEVATAMQGQPDSALRRRAETGTTVVSIAVPIQRVHKVLGVVLLTGDTRDITKVVRAERLASFQLFCLVFALTLFLSVFLARTIARPIRRLALAADRVRLGRARDVAVPRLPRRTDEIGQLARALSDMTQALHSRMDAIESFAADVSHEIKNPLSSLRSAVESLGRVKDPALQAQLLAIIRDDVARLDRLITDIADASRMDAELSRVKFEPVDLGEMIATLLDVYKLTGQKQGVSIAYARPPKGAAVVMGMEVRLGQVVRNLIDNATSFSPADGNVRVMLSATSDQVRLIVDDDGPGIPDGNLHDIFRRFYSERPSGEDFGQHSGLGLAISKQIVEAHGGTIQAFNRRDNGRVLGARFIVELPRSATGR